LQRPCVGAVNDLGGHYDDADDAMFEERIRGIKRKLGGPADVAFDGGLKVRPQ
jgi:hypothetical protein